MTPPPARHRVAYIDHGSSAWVDVAARLRDEMAWDPVYWIAEPALGLLIVPRFPGIIFHPRSDANQMISPPPLASVVAAPLDEPYIRSMAGVQLVAMNMLGVLDSLDALTLSERARFVRRRLGYWRSIVAALRLDAIVFPASPRTTSDYLIREVSRREGIRAMSHDAPDDVRAAAVPHVTR